MEGPSLFLAAKQLAPFIGQKIKKVEGNTQIGKERLQKETVLDVFSWGKHLVFQFETFALRVHFLLYGTFEATVNRKKVTGDYPKKIATPRLSLSFQMGHIEMYNCSLRFIESSHAQKDYDYSIDVMSPKWDPVQALLCMKADVDREIADVLLDQTIFAGVGNIIKNEVLYLVKAHPESKVSDFSDVKLRKIIKTVIAFCQQFFIWRQAFELRKHYQIYRQKQCPRCEGNVVRKKTGLSKRWSFFCPKCQTIRDQARR